jgi:hypothetical protein
LAQLMIVGAAALRRIPAVGVASSSNTSELALRRLSARATLRANLTHAARVDKGARNDFGVLDPQGGAAREAMRSRQRQACDACQVRSKVEDESSPHVKCGNG